MGTQPLPQKGAEPATFGPCLRDIVLDGNPAPPSLQGHSPQFLASVRCGQTAGWTKMPLGMEVGLNPGDFALDGTQPPPEKGGGAPSPIFGSFLLWPNGWMNQDATRYGCRPPPRGLCVKLGPSSLPKRGQSPLPNF